jgi:hypothetical protein
MLSFPGWLGVGVGGGVGGGAKNHKNAQKKKQEEAQIHYQKVPIKCTFSNAPLCILLLGLENNNNTVHK